MSRNYHIAIWHDEVWEAIDEHSHNSGDNTYKGYGVVNPDNLHIGPQFMTFPEALAFCQRLRRATSGRDK